MIASGRRFRSAEHSTACSRQNPPSARTSTRSFGRGRLARAASRRSDRPITMDGMVRPVRSTPRRPRGTVPGRNFDLESPVAPCSGSFVAAGSPASSLEPAGRRLANRVGRFGEPLHAAQLGRTGQLHHSQSRAGSSTRAAPSGPTGRTCRTISTAASARPAPSNEQTPPTQDQGRPRRKRRAVSRGTRSTLRGTSQRGVRASEPLRVKPPHLTIPAVTMRRKNKRGRRFNHEGRFRCSRGLANKWFSCAGNVQDPGGRPPPANFEPVAAIFDDSSGHS